MEEDEGLNRSKASALCQQHIDYIEDEIAFANQSPVDSEFISAMQENIELLERCKSKFQNKIKFTPENILSDLLETRLFFLFSRHAVRSECHQQLANKEDLGQLIIYGPTKPDCFDKLDAKIQNLARISTDRYQTVNKLILLMWQLVDPRTLKADTKLKVRVSTSLWSNLRGEREYLGHPDEAIVTYADDSNLPYVKLHGNDIKNFMYYILPFEPNPNIENKIELLNWTTNKKSLINLCNALPFASEAESRFNNAKAQRCIPYKPTHYDYEMWEFVRGKKQEMPKDAPYPDWLIPYTNITTLKASYLGMSNAKESRNPALEKKENQARGKKKKTSPSSKLKPSVENEEEDKIELPSTIQMILPTIAAETDNEEDLNNNNSKSYDPVRPSGMRRFHDTSSQKMEFKPEPRVLLKGKHLSTFNAIFDPKQFQKVSFQDVKVLWQHILGEKSVVESTGSSHKKLRGPHGEVFGIFAHSNNMTYGPRSIKYIRDALIQIGYRPTEE